MQNKIEHDLNVSLSFKFRTGNVFITCLSVLILFISCRSEAQNEPAVSLKEGRLIYVNDEAGNRVPDFSFAGYMQSEIEIPYVPTAVFVSCEKGDQTTRIQQAIDYVSQLSIGENGFRGAILLDKGIYEVAGGLHVKSSGIVLRGSGNTEDGTIILGSGFDRETLLRVYGKMDFQLSEAIEISDEIVPVGSMNFTVATIKNLKVGDEIRITRPSTKDWIDELAMKDFGGETGYIGWRVGERDIQWDRTITKITGNEIAINAPITTAIDRKYGSGTIQKISWQGKIQNVGIENLKLQSTYDQTNPKDEQHRWMAITFESIRNAWVRQVNFQHFAGSAVAIWNTGSQITVEDCQSLAPVSEIGGQRRYTFFTEGQQCLFQRIYSEYGYHDFGVGFMAAGPNAFVECQSYLPLSFSGTIDSWASGVLFDIVNIDGQAIRFGNRGMEAQGAGWSAANSMIWQSSASLVECSAPPTAINWAYGVWSQFSGNGDWHESNGFLKPRSLFYGQLSDRLNKDMAGRAQLLPMTTEATSSPTVEQAEVYVKEAYKSPLTLQDWIVQASLRNPISTEMGKAKDINKYTLSKNDVSSSSNKELQLKNGKLIFGDALATGNRQNVQWWRGNVRDYDASKAKSHLTRFVPGRVGTGHTDDINKVAESMIQNNTAVLDHNYGLWYDRRRDDHERIRRMNGEVWAPFYELPFARSGEGTAWDGLSKYDLTKYNFWYWNRLKTFVDLADKQGLVLYHQNYFQHNILEAGGHYADFPWRTANNVNNTPFPEPVNYAGDKRIFMAEQFYDISDSSYRALHQAYIRKCLDNFSDNKNVIQFISAEYTGPLTFVEFWLDEISKWELETGKNALVAISVTKDVQDAILNDPIRSKNVDVIDIQYWWYGEAKDGSTELYAPKGGQNLAPRQHARLVKTPKETFETTYQVVLEYKKLYPEKAVIHNTNRSASFGWAIFMAGGSLMNVPKVNHIEFLTDAAEMNPSGQNDGYKLLNTKTGEQIIYVTGQSVKVDLTNYKDEFELIWINHETGELVKANQTLSGGQMNDITNPFYNVIWINKKN